MRSNIFKISSGLTIWAAHGSNSNENWTWLLQYWLTTCCCSGDAAVDGPPGELIEFKNMKVLLPTVLSTQKLRDAVTQSGAHLTTQALLDSKLRTNKHRNNESLLALEHCHWRTPSALFEAAGECRRSVRPTEARYHYCISRIHERIVTWSTFITTARFPKASSRSWSSTTWIWETKNCGERNSFFETPGTIFRPPLNLSILGVKEALWKSGNTHTHMSKGETHTQSFTPQHLYKKGTLRRRNTSSARD